jgi:RNA polymerase sigma-70 factor (ECF subfamily)
MSVRLGDDFGRVLAAARAGEEWAVTSIFRAIQPGLLRYLGAREPGEAEDIAAQVWLEVARSLPAFTGCEDELRALVFTIGRRRLSNVRRGRTRRPDPVDREMLEVIAAVDDPAEAVAARVASADAIARVIRMLRPEQADVVLLRVVADLSVEEVAAIVGKSPSAVRVIQHRALRRLAGQLRGKGVTPPPNSGM